MTNHRNISRDLRSLIRVKDVLPFVAYLFVTVACAQSPTSSVVDDKISGSFKCDVTNKEQSISENLHVEFEVVDSVVKKFTSSWALSSSHPDLRPGYATTSQMNLNELQQLQRSGDIILKLQVGRHRDGQENCEIKIRSDSFFIHLVSSNCDSPSLTFDFIVDRNTGVCRKAKQH